MRKLFFILLVAINCSSYGLNPVDSLKQQLEVAIDDTSRLNLLLSIGEFSQIYRISYWDSIRIKSDEIGYKPGIMRTRFTLAYLYKYQGNIDSAYYYYNQCHQLALNANDSSWIAFTSTSLALMYRDQGLIEKSFDFEYLALKISEIKGLKYDAGNAHINLASLQMMEGNFNLALDHLLQANKYYKSINYWEGIASIYSRLGTLYYGQQEYERAKNNYLRGVIILDSIGNYPARANLLLEYGKTLCELNDKDSCLKCYSEALLVLQKQNNEEGIIRANELIGSYYFTIDSLDVANVYFKEALNRAVKYQSVTFIQSGAYNLFSLNKQLNYYKEALEMYELHIQMRDSIKNEETQKAAIRQQTKYEFEKAQLVAEQKRKETLRLQEERTKRRNNLQYSVIFIAILGVFGMVLALGKISVSPKVAEGLIFFAFLLFFEFLLVLSDPYVEGFTDGEPMYKLTVNALLAAFIFPAHSFFERVLKRRLIKSK